MAEINSMASWGPLSAALAASLEPFLKTLESSNRRTLAIMFLEGIN